MFISISNFIFLPHYLLHSSYRRLKQQFFILGEFFYEKFWSVRVIPDRPKTPEMSLIFKDLNFQTQYYQKLAASIPTSRVQSPAFFQGRPVQKKSLESWSFRWNTNSPNVATAQTFLSTIKLINF